MSWLLCGRDQFFFDVQRQSELTDDPMPVNYQRIVWRV